MTSRSEDTQDLLEPIRVAARAMIPDNQLPMLSAFIEHLYSGLAREDHRETDPEKLCRLASSFLEWAEQRGGDRIRVRIFNPPRSENPWNADRTVIQVVTGDIPFLVDSLTGELGRRELAVHQFLHPQIPVRRDADGKLQEIVAPTTETSLQYESFMHVEIDRLTQQPVLVELETALRKVLADVRLAVQDWPEMRSQGHRVRKELEANPPAGRIQPKSIEEAKAFLDWIDEYFTFLGYLSYTLVENDGERYLRPDVSSGLGLLRKLPLGEKATGQKPLRPAARAFLDSRQIIAIAKTTTKATVHRNAHMDLISVKRFGDDGELTGEYRFWGLFTSRAYSIPVVQIPLVRRKVAKVMSRTRFRPASHDGKVLRYIVEHYPRDELFQISPKDLQAFALRILQLQLRPRLALLVRYDEEERFASCMVYIPKERLSTRLRVNIQEILEQAFRGEVTDFFTRITERPLAQLQFLVEPRHGNLPRIDQEQVEERLAEVARPWSDHLKGSLGARRGEEVGMRTWRRYREAFPAGYQTAFSPEDAADDIAIIDRILDTGVLGLRLYRRRGAAMSRLHLRTFEPAIPAPLSSILPMLENMGLRVNSELPFEIRPADSPNPVWVRDFELLTDDFEVDPEKARDNFQESLLRIWSRELESDGFNQLVLRAGLTWRQVVILRAYCRYLRQVGVAFSQRYIESSLARNPEIARLLVELFHESLDPARQQGSGDLTPEQRREALRQDIRQALETVGSVDEDRILGAFLDLIHHTLRTNYFQTDADGTPKEYLSLKLDGRKIRGLPEPRPEFEIFVYSTRMEAVHLRGGKVARGGIRWSDRREDFRTEILGLVKSQMVKNAVIVPVGAKGGFVVKQPPLGDREAVLAEGTRCYKTMIRGMLDITDNLVGETVVPPKDVVRRDDDDPYLVVAADKGTATFSDLANQVAEEYGFWLGDAFASGGSAGYDHKKMGITARGAWESVKMHFREMGHNIQTEPFDVVGVGDMSGDVFGNGMLLSEQIRLVGAFNHLHVFVDPDPDPAASFAERKRLFSLPRSSWADYAPEALSEGGAIFERSARTITVSPQVKARLGLSQQETSPNELIRALLQCSTDLLWFGGIGTYVKAHDESNRSVGDRNNDEIRVDGGELGAKVIGEGANLGVTQAGRVEFALAGGRVNTDFIDNSGGVDCSDHEVNIKVALADAIAVGELPPEERNQLLAEMTEEVADLVLRDNYLQSHALSITEAQKGALLDEQSRLMRLLERSGQLDRRLAGLPDDSTLAERKDQKRGLTRPEISVLLAYSKIFVYNHLLDSQLPDDVLLREDLVRYFPLPLQWRFRGALERHRLRREIVATHVTNSLINRVGPTFVSRLAEETGSKVSDIARAYAAVREIFDLRSLWEDIEALDDKLPADLLHRIYLDSIKMAMRTTRWFLRYARRPLDVSTCVAKYEPDIIIVAAQIDDLLPPYARQRVRRKYRRLRDSKVPGPLATRAASLDMLPAACDVARCAQESGVPVERIGKVYFTLGEKLGFNRLRREARKLAHESPWQQAAVTATIDELFSHQAEMARQAVKYSGTAREAIEAWAGDRTAQVQRIENLLTDFEDAGRIEFPMVILAERELRRMVEG